MNFLLMDDGKADLSENLQIQPEHRRAVGNPSAPNLYSRQILEVALCTLQDLSILGP
jgi:hypothetical protein